MSAANARKITKKYGWKSADPDANPAPERFSGLASAKGAPVPPPLN